LVAGDILYVTLAKQSTEAEESAHTGEIGSKAGIEFSFQLDGCSTW
jgi:hypothetical protein